MKHNTNDWLLIADGERISKKKLQLLSQGKKVIVLDGAYQYTKSCGLKIDVLLGDFDTINPIDLAEARKNLHVVEASNQNKTDLEKAIEYLDTVNVDSIHIAAATGKRLQHTLYNLLILKKYHNDQRPLILVSEIEIIRYYQDAEIEISGYENDNIALLGFPEGIITTSGLKYDVKDFVMQFEKHNSICNVLVSNHAHIKIIGGVLVIHEPKEWQ